MNCIAAVDKDWAIGVDNRLLFHIPKDMEFFKEKTMGKVVVMGKNTLMSLPDNAPLKNRTNIVLSKSLQRQDCIVCPDLKSLFKSVDRYDSDDVFLIGGEQLYRLLLPYCSKAYITKINAKKQANKHFVNLDICKNWEQIYKSEPHIYNGIEYFFCEYRNNSVKPPTK